MKKSLSLDFVPVEKKMDIRSENRWYLISVSAEAFLSKKNEILMQKFALRKKDLLYQLLYQK